MQFRTTFKISCLSAFITLGACDPDVDVDARTVDVDAVSVADKIAEVRDVAEVEAPADELSLEFSDAVNASNASCWQGQIQANWNPSGICGGCKIQSVYPGQKYIESYRVCNGGTWSPWYQGGTECVDC